MIHRTPSTRATGDADQQRPALGSALPDRVAIDYTTHYLGLTLRSPLVVAASPLGGHLPVLRRLEELGAAAVVLPSLFAEQLQREEMEIHNFLEQGQHSQAESPSYFPDIDFYNAGRQAYETHVRDARQQLGIPLIASLNGGAPNQWTDTAKRLADAGADALELNLYEVVTDPMDSSQQVEDRQLALVDSVRRAVTLPIAVKIGNAYTALPHFAQRLATTGVNGLVLFNRYLEPDMDLQAMAVVPQLELSRPSEMRVPLRWIAILRDQLSISLAASSGVHSGLDAVKLLLAGADVVMMASALLRHGVEHLEVMFLEMQHWLRDREYASIAQLKGSMSRLKCANPEGFERANYVQSIVSYV